MEKHVLWVICFLLLTHIAEGQQVLRKDSVRQRDSADIVPARVVSAPANDISNVFPLSKKVAGYTPVTPSASRLMNEINHPVDYGTGAVDVSIPIHTIRTRDFTLPIVLRCKMTGIKASETNYSWVGIGWNLEAEPAIIRQVRGKNDEDYYVNYDVKNGKVVTIGQLFSDMAAVKECIDRELSRKQQYEGYLLVDEIPNPENFYVNNYTICFVFNPYEVAAYAAGVVSVEIPIYELSDYMTDYGKTLFQLQ